MQVHLNARIEVPGAVYHISLVIGWSTSQATLLVVLVAYLEVMFSVFPTAIQATRNPFIWKHTYKLVDNK